MHAPRMGRRFAALTEVQEIVANSVDRVKRRALLLLRRSSNMNHDPVLAMLAAARVDDEPITDDDRRHIDEGWQAYRDGRVISAEEAKRACLDATDGTGRVVTDRTVPV